MLKNWLKIFLYQIKNNKLFTALNVLGLSMGIAGLIFAILYWNNEQSYNAWNPGKEVIFNTVTDMGADRIWGSSSAAVGPRLATEVPEVESYCYMNAWYNSGIINYKSKKILCQRITDSQQNFFTFFPFEIISGNADTAIADDTSMAISVTMAKSLFGNENPMGKQVLFDKSYFTIKAVYKITGKSSYQPEIVINNLSCILKPLEDRWGNFSFGLLLKLKDPAQASAVAKKIANLYFNYNTKVSAKESGMTTKQYINKYGSTNVILEPLKDIRLHSLVSDVPEGKGSLQFLVIMMVLSVLILILSVVNYVNLATANAIKRAKEVGVRKIMGAAKGNIIKQFVFETAITTLFAIVLSLVIAELLLPHYNKFLNKGFNLNGSQFYLQLLIIFIVVVIVAGIFPAVYVSNFETLKVLKGNFSRSKSGIWLRNGMLILQFAIASFFITGSYIVYQQVKYMTTKDLGFNGSKVIDISYNNTYDPQDEEHIEKILQKFSNIKHELLAVNGVEKVSAGAFTFGNGSVNSSGFNYGEIFLQPESMSLDFGMLEMMKIRIKEGRDLSEKFASDTISSVLLNETAIKMMREKAPIGKEFMYNDQKVKIVGVVKDFHLHGLDQQIPPMIFYHFKTVKWMVRNVHDVYITVKPEQMETALAAVEKIWTTKVDPGYPFSYNFVDKNFARSYQNYVQQRNLFTLLNIVVVIIALFGLFALASYSIQRRMKEIAIRKTLGAETKVLLKELSKQYIIFCMIGFTIAIVPVWILLQKWLENFAYRITITVLPFATGFIVLLALTLSIVLSQAYLATKANVLKYLKYE